MVLFIKVKEYRKRIGFEQEGNKFSVGNVEFKGFVIFLSKNVYQVVIQLVREIEGSGFRFRFWSY